MAQMLNNSGGAGDSGPAGGGGDGAPPSAGGEGDDGLAALRERWQTRLAQTKAGETDPALQALVTDLLRTGEQSLLAKAVMLFPDAFPRAFPQEGTLASAKFDLAAFLKTADPESLPTDAAFFAQLERYALSSSLTAHPDTDLIRSLHDEFGSTALVHLVGALPARFGALLFALAPNATQHEAVGLMTPQQALETTDQLMRSNRMDPTETAYLLEVLGALRQSAPIPAPPEHRVVTDRGTEFSATTALSILLPQLDAQTRATVVNAAASRLNGSLPSWVKGTLFAEMLLRLDPETRTDLLLEVDVTPLAAWLQLQSPTAQSDLMASAPSALRAALGGTSTPNSTAELYAHAGRGREALSKALQRRLLRGDIAFESLLV